MSEYDHIIKSIASFYPHYFEKKFDTISQGEHLADLYQERYGNPFSGDLKQINSDNTWTFFCVDRFVVYFFKTEEDAMVAKLLT